MSLENPHGFKRAPGVIPGIQLALTDSGTGATVMAKLTYHDAKQLYRCLRDIFGDYSRPTPEPFTTVPRLDIGSQLIGHLPPEDDDEEESRIIVP